MALGALLLAPGCGASGADAEELGQQQAPLTFNAISRESVSIGGVEGNAGSLLPNVSSNGRFITFFTRATNLFPGDVNGNADVVRRDRDSGAISLVSVSSTGVQGNDSSTVSQPSADGRFVVFESRASNLVPGDTNNQSDVFVRDMQTGQTTRVSVSSAGVQANAGAFTPSISANGRFVAFTSSSTNLVSGDTNGVDDVFVRDLLTGQTTRVSVSSAGVQGNDFSATGSPQSSAISADGSVVVFESSATNLVAGDTNGFRDVFANFRATGQTVRVSLSSAGVQGNAQSGTASISGNGRFAVFVSDANNLTAGDVNATTDVFVRDLNTNTTTIESVSSAGVLGNGPSSVPDISDDGRFIAFASIASNLVAGDTNGATDVIARDRALSSTIRVDVSNGGAQTNDGSGIQVSISGNGLLVAFDSAAVELVFDMNHDQDVFAARLSL